MTKKQKTIMDAWAQADEDFPDKSTEFITAIVCDRTGVDHSDVMDALWADHEKAISDK